LEGWEPAEHVETVRGKKGRKKIITRDPEWDPEDRALIAAYVQYKADLCPKCGMHKSESLWRTPGQTDADIIEFFRTHKRASYHAAYFTCRGCVAMAKAQKAQEKVDAANLKNAQGQGKVLELFPEARSWFAITRSEFNLPA
jgi:hypothetical protein